VNRAAKEPAKPPTVLHLAPHPDDELAGCPATLMALRDAGWRVVNLVCSLGAAQDQRSRRGEEAREASRRAGFELRISEAPLREHDVLEVVSDAIEGDAPRILVAPSPHDAHPSHELVGRSAIAACEGLERSGGTVPVVLLWGLWADLAFPTLAVAFGEDRMREVLECFDAYTGELLRNDYRRFVRGRSEVNASLGPERVFGYGSNAPAFPALQFVELICELSLVGGDWRLGSARWLDLAEPLGKPGSSPPDSPSYSPDSPSMTEWLHSPSLSSLYGRHK